MSRPRGPPDGGEQRRPDPDADEPSTLRSVLSGLGTVLLIGVLLVGVSGVWPPVVAVPSASMAPNMKVGDLVYVMDTNRFTPEAAHADTGVVTYKRGQEVGYTKFDRPGDVIIFEPGESERRSLVIHRAMFYVEEGENWYAEARQVNAEAVGSADSCQDMDNCPAPHAGFVTKGDNSNRYDQVAGLAPPVRPSWVVGTAEYRIPGVGIVRFLFVIAGDVPDSGPAARLPA